GSIFIEAFAQSTSDESPLKVAGRRSAEGVDQDRSRSAGKVEGCLAVPVRSATKILVRWLADVATEVNEVAFEARMICPRGPTTARRAEISEVQDLQFGPAELRSKREAGRRVDEDLFANHFQIARVHAPSSDLHSNPEFRWSASVPAVLDRF